MSSSSITDPPATTFPTLAPTLSLAGEFAETTLAEWRAAVDKVIGKGRTDLTPEALADRFQNELVTRTVDGLVIEPLYTERGEAPEPGVPGAAPFIRGTKTLAHRRFGWDVRQRVLATPDTERVLHLVMEELERGATSVLLDVSSLETVDVDYLDAALAGVHLDLAPLALTSGRHAAVAAHAFLELLSRRSTPAAAAVGFLGLDPIGGWLGAATGDIDAEMIAATAIAVRCVTTAPGVRSLEVDATVVHEGGGGDVEELGYAAAAGLQYLRALVAAGLSIDDAMSQLEFRFAATPDQFLTIAKLRAGRRIWQRIADLSGASPAAQVQRQHAVSSSAASSRYDVWVNMLRATVECFGAGVGGADAVTILPHDEPLTQGGSDLGRRMARNTQIVLIEESNLAKVIDMAGGSYYVEQLTDQLAGAAWAFMQDLERAGGVVSAVRDGVLQRRVNETKSRRDTAVATRRFAITGVTEFPNIAEPAPPAAVLPDSDVATSSSTDASGFTPLRPLHYADQVEAQRARADRLGAGADTGGRPRVFLAALGSTSTNAARVTFAKNLFEVGGIEGIVGESLTDPAGVAAAFRSSGARLACICASDAVYRDLAVPVARALRDAGAERLYLAGRPKGMDDELADAGVDEQFAAGSNVVAVVRTALDTIGAR